MPIVELPDGREVEFPDDMDHGAIASAIQKNFPEFAPKKPMVERVGAALKSMPDPLRDKRNADADKRSVMERVGDQAPAPSPAAVPTETIKSRGLFAELKEQEGAPFIKQRAQETTDIIDPSAQARTRRLINQGMNVEQAQSVGKRAAAAKVLPGMEGGASRMESTDFDFATRKKYNEDPFFKNPVVRGAVKGVEGYQQGIRGVNQFAAEVLGADNLASTIAGNTAKSRAFTDAMGTPTDHLSRNFEGAISSVATQLPALIGGAVTGSSALALGSMFTQTFGTEYTGGRARGQDIADATKRAGLMASFEVIGERLGLGKQLDLIRNSARGVETNVLAKFLGNTLKNEVPGEALTTTGQFITDKYSSAGLTPEAGFADYLSQMADTVTQTFMQGGVMAAGGGGLNAAMRGMQTGDQARTAEAAADAARSEALSKWRTSGLSARPAPAASAASAASAADPAPARREPTLGDVTGAASVDDAIRAADALVNAVPSAADIEALEQSAGINATTEGVQDAVLPPDAIVAGAGRDQVVGGLAADNPAGSSGLALPPEQQPGTVAVLGEPAALDPVRAGAGTDANAPLTPQRDAIDAVIDQNEDWHEFPAETGTLNIPRAEMPQIAAHARGALTQFLKARGVAHEQIEVPAEDLKPTQAEFSLAKVQKAMDFEGGNRSILVSSDGHVLDGHHQWMAALDAGQPVKAIRLNAPIAQLLDQVREFPSTGVSEGAPSQEVFADVSERPQVPEETQAAPGAQGAPQAADSAASAAGSARPAAPVGQVSNLEVAPAGAPALDVPKPDAEVRGEAVGNERARIESKRKKKGKPQDDASAAPGPTAGATEQQAAPGAPDATDGSSRSAPAADAAPTESSTPAAAPEPDEDTGRDDGADIPLAFFKKVKVDHDLWIEDEGVMETHKVPASEALASVREDISNLRALLSCMKG